MMMSFVELLLIAIGLSMDAFSVSICKGLTTKRFSWKMALVCGLWFGFFQALMPVIGYYLAEQFQHLIESIDHWVAFGLLLLIGGFMIFEGVKGIVKPETVKEKEFSWREVIFQGVATSIDALAVGITLTTLPIFIVWDGLTIAAITFAICLVGFFLGTGISRLLKGRYSIANIIGGVILIGIGVSIVIEHMVG